ncbi:MAG: hypothetical protein R3C53_01625 [Pirellulaceae bacterium]
MSIDLAVQEEKIADPNLSEEEKKAATDALQATQQAVDETREQSLQLLREGLRACSMPKMIETNCSKPVSAWHSSC